MNYNVFSRALFSIIISFIFAVNVYRRYDDEIVIERSDGSRRKYPPYIPGYLLPLFLASYAALILIFEGPASTAKEILSLCFGLSLHISVYYIILLLIIPLLRRYISSRACAMLWMIPNFLYFAQHNFMELTAPHFVIYVSKNLAWILFAVWLTGFLAVLIWKTAEHLRFRRQILKEASPVTNPDILLIWSRTLMHLYVKKPLFKLVVSPNVQTPLSVGLFQRTTCIILPERAYSTEELELILKHEIIHILRQDSWSKYFLVFCTAICWFNPLMWIAMRKSAEDLELSCDETVLLGEDLALRQKYASLLLHTAGDERGFTTCLSASAQAMRYRLKNIITAKKRRSGAIIVGTLFFILSITYGYVCLAYDDRSGAEVIYKSEGFDNYSLFHVSLSDDYLTEEVEIADENAFHEYLSELTLYKFTGNYSFSEDQKGYSCLIETPDGILGVTLYDHVLKLTSINDSRHSSYYYMKEKLDWDYLDTIIIPYSSPDN